MLIKKSREKSVVTLFANLTVGILLVVTGILMFVFDINIIENKKAIIGLSFIPLAAAFVSGFNLIMIKKHLDKMKAIVIAENDERLVAIQNETDATAFRILRWALMLVFFGYTLAIPKDVFESPAWWVVFSFFFMSYVLQGILFKINYDKSIKEDDVVGEENING